MYSVIKLLCFFLFCFLVILISICFVFLGELYVCFFFYNQAYCSLSASISRCRLRISSFCARISRMRSSKGSVSGPTHNSVYIQKIPRLCVCVLDLEKMDLRKKRRKKIHDNPPSKKGWLVHNDQIEVRCCF